MTPRITGKQLLDLIDSGVMWDTSQRLSVPRDLLSAYRLALELGDLRVGRGERVVGVKIGLTNQEAWQKLDVSAPIWGHVWDRTYSQLSSGGYGRAKISMLCQPRLEPEIVFRFNAPVHCSMSRVEVFESLKTIAPAFEIVQCHAPGWQLSASLGIVDAGLHGQLWVGPELPIHEFFSSMGNLESGLSSASVVLSSNSGKSYLGCGSNVLGNPFNALCEFLSVLRNQNTSIPLDEGFLVTTGSWTEAPNLQLGEDWVADFSIFNSAIRLSTIE